MNWYKTSQSLEQNPNVSLRLDSFASALPESEKIIEQLDMEEILNSFALLKKYRSPIDYALCSLYPELEQKCRDFYDKNGKGLTDLYNPTRINKIDNIVARALVYFYRKQQEFKRSNELV